VYACLGSRRRVSVRSVNTILPERGGKFRFVRNFGAAAARLFEEAASC
jgi:hypothetical protein